jgi:hypothetical protein
MYLQMEQQAAEQILTPVLEASVLLAAKYATACGRSTVTTQDVALGLMFAARNVTGRHIGTLLSDDEEDEDDSIEEVDENEEPFTEYTGDEELYLNMNQCSQSWDAWEPESPVELALKTAINKAKELL